MEAAKTPLRGTARQDTAHEILEKFRAERRRLVAEGLLAELAWVYLEILVIEYGTARALDAITNALGERS